MADYIVVVKFKVYDKYLDEFETLLKDNALESLEEPGCKVFDIGTEGNTYFLYEVYNSRADFQLHLETVHFKEFNSLTEIMVIEKIVETYYKL